MMHYLRRGWHRLCNSGGGTSVNQMKKFRFTLRSVAIQRNLREENRRQQFSTAAGAYAAAADALAVVLARIAELSEIIAAERAGCFRPASQVAFMQALSLERDRENDARRALAQAQAAMEAARAEWVLSRRDVRLVETLETKARAAHRQAGEREEQALLDDRTNALSARAGRITTS